MTTQELAIRVPPALEQAGVKIVEAGGTRAVEIPDELRKAFNVLLPISEVAQADPNWTPSFRVVKLDPDPKGPHFYHDSNSRSGELSPRKTALSMLASVAGLNIKSTSRMPVSQLREHEIGWQATLTVRRSDGTLQEFTSSKVVNLDVERERILGEVRTSDRYSNDAARRAAFERRWLYEREHADSKAETKAIERTVRLALQLPHAFPAADAAKPFLVVGWSFTPDTTDPEIKRMIVEAGLSGARSMYGDRVALPAETSSAPEAGSDVVEGSATAVDEEPAFAGDEPGEEPATAEPEGEPEGEAQATIGDASQAEAVAAGLVVVGFGKFAGSTIDQIAREKDKGAEYVLWIADTMEARRADAAAVKSAAKRYADAFLRNAT